MEMTKNYSPKMLRELFNTDNSGISALCREAKLVPKKDTKGNTYFTSHDIQTLRKIKNLHSSANSLMTSSSGSLALPLSNSNLDETFKRLSDKFESFQNAIETKISTVIDEKLDGMDEVVVELIRCKTENETLRYKMNEMEKLNYNLKNQLSSYKNIGFNLYIKKEL